MIQHNFNATRIVASTLGIITGLYGIEHGYFETQQGNVRPGGLLISAIGPACQPDKAWHACEPAMTVIPNFFVTGILAMIAGLIVVVWSATQLHRKYAGWILIMLVIVQVLVGGGIIPLAVGISAGLVATRIGAPLPWWRSYLSVRARAFLASLWPWPLIAYVSLQLGTWIMGGLFNDVMLSLSVTLGIVVPLGLILLAISTGFAYDIHNSEDALLQKHLRAQT
jgi:hypothetical protein